jgi:hypothetical protein
MTFLISKTEFAKRCGVKLSNITRWFQGPGLMAGATNSGKVDWEHPAAQAYYKRHQPDDPLLESARALCEQEGRRTPDLLVTALGIGQDRALAILKSMEPLADMGDREISKLYVTDKDQEAPEDIESLAELTLRELINRYGTADRFRDWLRAVKEIEAINEKRIKNAMTLGKVVSRSLIDKAVMDPINSAHLRLMTDGAKTITATVIAKHNSKINDQAIEALVSDLIGSFIKPAKNRIIRNLAEIAGEDDEA